jgi:hypothetical protein
MIDSSQSRRRAGRVLRNPSSDQGFGYRFKSVEIKAQLAGSSIVHQARHVAQASVLVYVFKRLPGPSARIAGE